MPKLIGLMLIMLICLIGCNVQNETDQEAVKKFFATHRIGSSPDYAVMKNGTDHLLTIHGYANDLDVCLKLIEPYNRDASLSTFSGKYTCVPLNK